MSMINDNEVHMVRGQNLIVLLSKYLVGPLGYFHNPYKGVLERQVKHEVHFQKDDSRENLVLILWSKAGIIIEYS